MRAFAGHGGQPTLEYAHCVWSGRQAVDGGRYRSRLGTQAEEAAGWAETRFRDTAWFALLFWLGMALAALSRSTVQDGTGAAIGKDPRRTKRPACLFVGFSLPVTAACLARLSP